MSADVILILILIGCAFAVYGYACASLGAWLAGKVSARSWRARAQRCSWYTEPKDAAALVAEEPSLSPASIAMLRQIAEMPGIQGHFNGMTLGEAIEQAAIARKASER